MDEREDIGGILDAWPQSADGTDWDGKGLLELVRRDQSPFGSALSVPALIAEIERVLRSRVVDIPAVAFGAHNFGFHFILANRPNVIARVSRGDLRNPAYRESGTLETQLHHGLFELDVYRALKPLGSPFSGAPVYHRRAVDPAYLPGYPPSGICGRLLFVFEPAPGERYDYVAWRRLTREQKSQVLRDAAKVAARLFEFTPSPELPNTWMLRQACSPKARVIIRDFSGDQTTLPMLVPLLLPQLDSEQDEHTLYRPVLDHGDFGIHNMTISLDDADKPLITSVFDWEEGVVVPALLSEPRMVVTVDLVLNASLEPCIRRWGDGDTPDKMAEYRTWSEEYYGALFAESPSYRRALEAGRDARRLWTWLRHIDKGECDTLEQIEQLAAWAEAKHLSLGAQDGND
ncbi:monooxygenase [Purpureocillium lavendulum]|uniref:Monooxygenase n=1 Tax=Purpureocillium lavendulum TaxID=1247861 RepID=A0AB34G992_9HYPO|nr:monooxygenase [Purpureocillium lavendulum]